MKTFETSSGLLSRFWRWTRSLQIARPSERRLRVADTVSLGEKRFVAVVQVDGRHFLLAGGPANIALLAQLDEKDDFGEVLQKTMTVTPAPQPQLHEPQAAAPPQQEARPVRKRTARPGKIAEPLAAAPPTRASVAHPVKKTTSAGVKKHPPLAAKRGAKPSVASGRFGDIPAAAGGVRAFERWLGRTVPVASTPTASVSIEAPYPNANVSEHASSTPLSSSPALNERMQEVRPLAEMPLVQIKASTVEEYA